MSTPRRLDPAEVLAARDGDDIAREMTAAACLSLATAMAHTAGLSDDDGNRDDVIQLATVHTFEALMKSWNPERGAPGAFAKVTAMNVIKREAGRHSNPSASKPSRRPREVELLDGMKDPCEPDIEIPIHWENEQEVEFLLQAATPAQQESLRAFYGLSGDDPKQMIEIAEAAGVRKQSVHESVHSGLRRMRLAAGVKQPTKPVRGAAGSDAA
jgi:DNA-directed RNA polymerase specialized sigma24 family protein